MRVRKWGYFVGFLYQEIFLNRKECQILHVSTCKGYLKECFVYVINISIAPKTLKTFNFSSTYLCIFPTFHKMASVYIESPIPVYCNFFFIFFFLTLICDMDQKNYRNYYPSI